MSRVVVFVCIAGIVCLASPSIIPLYAQDQRLPELWYVVMSPSIAPTSIADFRRAIAYSIDRTAVASAARRSTSETVILASSIEDPRLPGYIDGSSDLYPYDPAKARQIIARVGWTSPLTIAIGTRTPSVFFGSIVHSIVQSIHNSSGLQVEVRSIVPESAFLSEVHAGAVPVALVGWISVDTDYGYPSYSLGIAHAYGALMSLPEVSHPTEAHDHVLLQKTLLRNALIVPLVFSYAHLRK
jgi:ABC-type transport system substrate-binding protein